MTNKGRPFYFDSNLFDAVGQPTTEELEKLLKYTDDQLALARSAAFNDGKKAGFTEAQNNIDKETQAILQKIEGHIAKLFAVESVRYERYEAEAVHLSYQIIKKIFPMLFEKIGDDLLQELMKNVIIDQKSISSLDIKVHTDIAPQVQEHIAGLTEKHGKTIMLSPSSSVPRNDCFLSWNYGGAILAPEKTAHKILLLLQETLADQGITVHDTNIQGDERGVGTDENNTGESV